MHKLAVFVEGQTEAVFLERLAQEIARERKKLVCHVSERGDHRQIRELRFGMNGAPAESSHYVLIYDCQGDNKVVSTINDQYDGLKSVGHQRILGLRDVYPKNKYEEIPKLREGMVKSVRKGPIPVDLALAIMEIEAWFIAEYTHFARINAKLTPDFIQTHAGFDPRGDVSRRPCPEMDLRKIYELGRAQYSKKLHLVKRTVDTLDFDRVRSDLAERIPDLRTLTRTLAAFF